MKKRTRKITYTALFVAIIAVVSQIAIPMPSLVPITLQTLIICLCGYIIGLRAGVCTVLAYILLGAVGAPVFSSFQGGFSVIIGHGGGFIIGFIPLVILCGVSEKPLSAILFGILGVVICHGFGVIWYMGLTSNPFIASLVLVSLPYIIKDIIFCVLAYFISQKIRKKLPL
ncbi:MAG: biotin transporter BioY [Clostridia bacterium]|nr:biotin transporter BioY [Clostridia bacterium]